MAVKRKLSRTEGKANLETLAFDERFGLLVEAEWGARENKRLARALHEAKLKLSQACLEAIDYPARRELDKAVVRQLATCRWVAEHHNVILVGATGVGKSFIACALAHQACRKGYRAGYRRASRLFHELTLARADGTYLRLLGKLARLDVLVIDDWGLAPVQDPERRDLLEILEDRYGARSTIITSQLPPAQWHDYLADATLADAICDRLRSSARQRPPTCAKRTLTAKGGQARRLTAPPSVAPLRSRCPDRSVHHKAIWVFTMTGMRNLHVHRAAPPGPYSGLSPSPAARVPGSRLFAGELLRVLGEDVPAGWRAEVIRAPLLLSGQRCLLLVSAHPANRVLHHERSSPLSRVGSCPGFRTSRNDARRRLQRAPPKRPPSRRVRQRASTFAIPVTMWNRHFGGSRAGPVSDADNLSKHQAHKSAA